MGVEPGTSQPVNGALKNSGFGYGTGGVPGSVESYMIVSQGGLTAATKLVVPLKRDSGFSQQPRPGGDTRNLIPLRRENLHLK